MPAEEAARHGFNDDAVTRALLRAPPSSAALDWVTATVKTNVAR